MRARGGAIYCENVDQYRLQICPATVLINRIRDINQHAIKYINAPYIFAGERKKIKARTNVNVISASLWKNSGIVPTSDNTVIN